MSCGEVLNTDAESTVLGGEEGGRETKWLHHFQPYREDNEESTFQKEKVKCLQAAKEAKKTAKRGSEEKNIPKICP